MARRGNLPQAVNFVNNFFIFFFRTFPRNSRFGLRCFPSARRGNLPQVADLVNNFFKKLFAKLHLTSALASRAVCLSVPPSTAEAQYGRKSPLGQALFLHFCHLFYNTLYSWNIFLSTFHAIWLILSFILWSEGAMPQKTCLIHANCQGDTLQFLLQNTQAFAKEYSIKKYTNYLEEEIEPLALAQCDLFLYQKLGNQWGELATEKLLQKLSPQAITLEIPNMFFNGYWPLWTNKTHMAYGDMLLEELCQRGLSTAEIVHLYIKGKISNKYDIKALRQISLDKEQQKEASLHIRTLDFIEQHWQSEQLFYTVNHPAPKLSLYVADAILQHLDFKGVDTAPREALLQHKEEFILPIHPQVGEYYSLPFASAQRLYPVYGQHMHFQTYIQAYVQCRLQKGPDAITDFVVYLHLLAQRAQSHG